MDYQQMTAPCGLACFGCPVHAAASDAKLRAKISQAMGVPEDKAQCPGCRASGGCIEPVGMTEPCKVWRCIEPKGLHNCSQCAEFPCAHLHPVADQAGQRPHNLKVFNLASIKRMGLEDWAAQEAAASLAHYYKGKLEL